jgi:arylsulfatase A-like enzyme
MKNFLYLSLLLIPFSFAELNKPNFIIIYLDDLGYADIGLYQDELLNTPNIDKLSASSQIWTNFYASSSVCTPSRAGLLTGRLPIRSGLYGDQIKVFFPGSNKGIPSNEITIADILKLNGYSTGIFGKWHLGDKSNYLPTRHGFDEWIGIPYSNDMDWEVDGITLEKLLKNPKNIIVDYAKIQPRIVEKIFNPDIDDWNVPLIKSVNKKKWKIC